MAAASEAYSHAAGAPNRRWTGRRNEWGGFEYEYDHEFREKGKDGRPSAAKPASPQYEKTFNQSDAPYWIFAGCVSFSCCLRDIIMGWFILIYLHKGLALRARAVRLLFAGGRSGQTQPACYSVSRQCATEQGRAWRPTTRRPEEMGRRASAKGKFRIPGGTDRGANDRHSKSMMSVM